MPAGVRSADDDNDNDDNNGYSDSNSNNNDDDANSDNNNRGVRSKRCPFEVNARRSPIRGGVAARLLLVRTNHVPQRRSGA